jgi:glycogen debranching enzyme
MSADFSIISKAREIAERDLRQCYFKGKVLASLLNFSDFWARDTFWALPGILKMGDFGVARSCFELFLKYQKADGLIPRKIALDYNGFKYLFKKSIKRKKPRAIYNGNIPISDYIDGNSLFIIALDKYLTETRDFDFAKDNFKKVRKIIEWYDYKLKNLFIKEYFLANWMDTIFKNGYVLYSNVLYCRALESFSQICRFTGHENVAIDYEEKHLEMRERINSHFWNGEFFDDQLGHHKHFDVAGNVTACFFGIAPPDRAEIIFKKLESIKKDKLCPTVDPLYPFWKICPAAYLLGIPEYQNGISWMWIDLLAVGALFKFGKKEEALKHFSEISEIIVKNGAVYETYWPDGRPFNKLLWKSAVPFAWASGLFLEIYSLIVKKQ